MTIEYNGRQILTDEDGYLKNEADWSLDFTLTVTGKVVMSLCSDTFKREAIKLKKFKKLYLSKKLTLDAIISQFKSWRSSVTRKQFHNHKAVKQLDNLFFQLFNLKYEDLKNGRSKRKHSE